MNPTIDATLTGHQKVDAIAHIRFEGDITPKSWFKHICYQTKKGERKADRLAVDILSDIVYWYRPYQKRDEITGEAVSWQKKFAEDLLRRSPDAFAETLNASVRCVRESMKLLEHMGLITIVLRPVKTAYGVIPNVMHIDINPEAIAAITYRPQFCEAAETTEKSLLTKWVTTPHEIVTNHLRNRNQPPTKSSQGDDEIGNSSIYIDFSETTPEISAETISPYSPPGDMNALEVLVEVEVEILEPEQEEIVAAPSVENPKQLPLLDKNSNPGEDKNSARRVATKDKVACDYQVLVDLYNEYKPPLWRKCQLTSDRERTLKGQFKQLGDKLAQVMIDALKWAESDDFWSGRKGKRSGKGKKFDLDSLFYQNRVQKWAGYLEEDAAEKEFEATHRGYSSAHVDQVHRTLANIADL